MRAPAAAAGFDAFWRPRYERALGVAPRPVVGEGADAHPDWVVHDIAYTSTDGFEIGGWLLVPRAGEVRRGLVVGHGYGGREGPDFDVPVTETAVLFPCFRGLSRSARAPISTDPAWHVLHDIDKPERYILGGCVEDLWVAVSVLTGLYPELAGRIGYSGMSFGGGIGALALAFESRIDRGHLVVPTFGNIPVWLSLKTVGSGNAVQTYRRSRLRGLGCRCCSRSRGSTRRWRRLASFPLPMRGKIQGIMKLSCSTRDISTILAWRSSMRSCVRQ
jgi:cephalosporin-C deacetylase